jgi:hypothetical protein
MRDLLSLALEVVAKDSQVPGHVMHVESLDLVAVEAEAV